MDRVSMHIIGQVRAAQRDERGREPTTDELVDALVAMKHLIVAEHVLRGDNIGG